MTINEFLRQRFPYFDVVGNHAWCDAEDVHIEVHKLNDHAVIEVYSMTPESCVTTTCDSTLEDDIVAFLDNDIDYMIRELNCL